MDAKAYRATLPPLNSQQAEALSRWARDNCWRSIVTRDRKQTLWVAIREKRRTKAMWKRHVAQVLNELAIDTRPLETRDWLRLCGVVVADGLIRQARAEPTRAVATRAEKPADSEDAKIIEIPGTIRASQRRGQGTTRTRGGTNKATAFEIVKA